MASVPSWSGTGIGKFCTLFPNVTVYWVAPVSVFRANSLVPCATYVVGVPAVNEPSFDGADAAPLASVPVHNEFAEVHCPHARVAGKSTMVANNARQTKLMVEAFYHAW